MTAKVDLSEFFKYSRPKKKPCAIGFVSAQLNEGENKQLAAALAQDNGLITSGAIAEWLKARQHVVSVPAVTAHRKGVCDCGNS